MNTSHRIFTWFPPILFQKTLCFLQVSYFEIYLDKIRDLLDCMSHDLLGTNHSLF